MILPTQGLSEVGQSGPDEENADPGTTPGDPPDVTTDKEGGEGWADRSTIDHAWTRRADSW